MNEITIDRKSTLKMYSNGKLYRNGYSEAAKHDIASALFPHLNEEQIKEKVTHIPRNAQYIARQCQSAYALIEALEAKPWLKELMRSAEQARQASLLLQRHYQQGGIDAREVTKIKGVHDRPLINYNAVLDALGHRLSDIEYKFQLSWTPLFDDANSMDHDIIEKHPRYKLDPRETIIEHSVYDIAKMPLWLIDLALYGKREKGYSLEEKGQLQIDGSENMSRIKNFLIASKPLKYAQSQGGKADTTERILSLSYEGKKVGYLLSEKTPTVYEEKGMKKHTNNFIRYHIFDTKQGLIDHLGGQIFPSEQKVTVRSNILDELCSIYPHLSDLYANQEARNYFAGQMKTLGGLGATRIEQQIKNALRGLKFTNRSADQLIISSIIRTLRLGIRNQEEKLQHLRLHLEALENDNEF